MCAIVYGPVHGLKKSGPDTKKQNSRSRGPAKANNHEQDVIATMFVALGRSREEREIARAQRSSRIVRPGPLDLYASNQEQRKNERTKERTEPAAPFRPLLSLSSPRQSRRLLFSRSLLLAFVHPFFRPSPLIHPAQPQGSAPALWPPPPPPTPPPPPPPPHVAEM